MLRWHSLVKSLIIIINADNVNMANTSEKRRAKQAILYTQIMIVVAALVNLLFIFCYRKTIASTWDGIGLLIFALLSYLSINGIRGGILNNVKAEYMFDTGSILICLH